MSYQGGMAVIHLGMPPRVPRTEYSAESHWTLVQAVTGIPVGASSTPAMQRQARSAFRKCWNYDLVWGVLTKRDVFGSLCTRMGHAEYAANGTDFQNVVQCPFQDSEDVLDFDPWQAYGQQEKTELTLQHERHHRANCLDAPDAVNTTGIYVTCISGLIEICGWEMQLPAVRTDAAGFGEMTDRYGAWMQQYFDALAKADVPVVIVHDDIVWTSGAFLKPAWYRRYVFPNYRKYFQPLLESGKKILFASDGNYTEFIDDIAACGVHGFVLEPTTDMKYIADRYGRTHFFIGNADTRILLDGTREAIRAEENRCMDIGKHCPGFFMAVGNHIPANTPVENALSYNEVYESLGRR